MKRAEVDTFEKVIGQLESIHTEISALTKKSPNDAVNAFKLGLINKTLERSNTILGEKYKPFSDFVSFSPDAVPSNSDVSFVVAQYIECAETFRSDHIKSGIAGRWFWLTENADEGPPVQTAPPKRINRKE